MATQWALRQTALIAVVTLAQGTLFGAMMWSFFGAAWFWPTTMFITCGFLLAVIADLLQRRPRIPDLVYENREQSSEQEDS